MRHEAGLAVSTIAILAACACAGTQRRAAVLPIDESRAQVVTFPADLRGVYIRPAGAAIAYCAEPSPDVALETLRRLTARLSTVDGTGGGLTAETSASVVALAGRSQLVLLARELLYRACELTANARDDEGARQARDLYAQVVRLIEELGAAEKADAEARRIRAFAGARLQAAPVGEERR